jgi:flagellar biosynthesis activator protein FlaF
MSNAALAYAKTAQQTLTPRELEAHVLMKAATKFSMIKEDWSRAPAELGEALMYNRKIWMLFVTAATGEESQLPKELRENIANLGIFVFNRTIEIERQPDPKLLGSLIEINRQVATGLRARPATP